MIPIMEPWIDQQEIDLVMDCLKTGWISSQGEYIGDLKRPFPVFAVPDSGWPPPMEPRPCIWPYLLWGSVPEMR